MLWTGLEAQQDLFVKNILAFGWKHLSLDSIFSFGWSLAGRTAFPCPFGIFHESGRPMHVVPIQDGV